jgi:hypothetical protein
VIEDFAWFLKLLKPELPATDQCLVLLYQCGPAGADFGQLRDWVHPRCRANLRRTLRRLVDDKAFSHKEGDHFVVTQSGRQEVEVRQLVEPT